MTVIKIDNIYHFNYHIIGDKKQPIILFLHGFLGDINEFHPIIKLLANQYCCLVVDLPGHGQTLITGSDIYYTMEKASEALIKFLDLLQIEKCFLFGYSMGGRIGLYLTLNYPEKFTKIILESTSPGLKTATEREQRINHDNKLARQLEIEDFKLFLTQWYEQPLFYSLRQNPAFKQLFYQRLKNNPLTLAKSLRCLSTGYQPSQWEQLKNNEKSLLFIVGEQDEKFVKINQEIVELCPFSQLLIVKNTGHNIHWEQTEKFVKIIRKFLN
jgi:2-succinyl-6-hydroxy-2,4-cyclohexadiene-1-carboxylate synthase